MPRVVPSRRDRPRPDITPARIRAVEAGSPAERAGVGAGWELLRVNRLGIPDILAYRRELGRGSARIEVRDPADGRLVEFEVAWEDPGLEFEDVIFDGIRLCANKCDFCYIHQMPQGMRDSLYIMDDDFRTSFLYGSFVTLTNLTDDDLERILDEQLSPLYVSVHSADEERRHGLMKPWPHKVPDAGAAGIRTMIERLEPIDLYTQMVLLPGRNDGPSLTATLEYLASRPNVLAVATVPVGLTGHRRNLPELEPYGPDGARAVLQRVRAFQERMLAERGTRFVFASDELYLVAGEPLPPAEAYEGYPMLENGIGMVRDFLDEPPDTLPERLEGRRRALLVTGKLFAPVLERAVAPLRGIDGLELEVRAVPNRTFGEVTTVAGLLAGRDLLEAVRPGEADLLLISPNMLKYGTRTMLDDLTVDDVAVALGMPVVPGGSSLGQLARTLLQGEAADVAPSFGFSTHAVKEASEQH